MEAFQSVTTCPPNGMIDARYLHMEAEYFELEKKQADFFLKSFVTWCESFFSDQFIVDWYWNGKKIKAETLLDIIKRECAGVIGVEGAVLCETIYNKRTLHAYKKSLLYPVFGDKTDIEVSGDYFTFYREQATKIRNKQVDWKNAVLSFFYETNRIGQTTVQRLEVGGYATKIPYHTKANLFYGDIGLSIPIFCLGEQISQVANKFTMFLDKLSEEIVNLNGRVAVTPINYPSKCSGHMKYFGNDVRLQVGPAPNGYTLKEWYPHFFICGAEWFNVISPLAQTHLPTLYVDAGKFPEVMVTKHSNGSINLKLRMRPDLVDVGDLQKMRDILYDGLYPGLGRILKKDFLNPLDTSFLSKPRIKWEIIPVHEEEIIETEDEILFIHAPCKDDNV